jgi:hypothetical protein
MIARNFLVVGFCLTLLCLLAVPATVRADELNQATKITFSEPVEVPGHLLAAGTYVFKLVDGPDRDIVQIWNADKSQLVATIFAVSDYRLQGADETVITFEERSPTRPEAIKTWFYPGERFGHEFVYPKAGA